ncbi:transposase [Rhizobiaceae bacterium CRRU44]|uniref:Transposase n=1 Tax=Ferranicluibacter rubi TaxID=2715133 RepID=A0AA44CB56_9HYPH|nr:transposase [Ferranicluibacter rubi]
MSDLFLLSERQMARISPFFPLAHGVPRVDDRRVVSGIVYVIRNGLQLKDAPKDYGPHKTLYNRFIRWSRLLCAIGGAELSAGSLQIFAQNMTAGRGFMAFAAVVFGAAHPIGSALAALFFSVVGALGIRAQIVFGDAVPHDLLLALPYLATIVGVWVSGRLRGGAKTANGFAELRDY